MPGSLVGFESQQPFPVLLEPSNMSWYRPSIHVLVSVETSRHKRISNHAGVQKDANRMEQRDTHGEIHRAEWSEHTNSGHKICHYSLEQL